MTRFELLAMLHGLGVIAWVGGGLALLVLHALAVRADDYDGLATAIRQSRVLRTCLYGPASLVTARPGSSWSPPTTPSASRTFGSSSASSESFSGLPCN
jgi:hypothetical protein